MLKKLGAVVVTIAIFFGLDGCSSNQKKRYEAEFLQLFDTMTKIVAYTDSKEEFTRFSQYVYDQLKSYHELYDIYNDYDGIHNLKTINDNAGKAPVTVDKKIIDLLLLAKKMYQKTNGKINVAFGSVLSIWHDYRTRGIDEPENAALPPMEKLEAGAKHTDINQVIIDKEASTVFLADAQMRLDVGSVGKGYATEQVALMAQAEGFTSCLLSVGGNVRAVGGKDNGKTPWTIGIQNPDTNSKQNTLYNVKLTDSSLVTSGNYQRYYTVNGKNYNHIIQPETLMPAEYFAAVSIICKDSGIADCLSTAVYNMPFEEGKALIESLPETEAVWIDLDGKTQFSSGFEKLLVK